MELAKVKSGLLLIYKYKYMEKLQWRWLTFHILQLLQKRKVTALVSVMLLLGSINLFAAGDTQQTVKIEQEQTTMRQLFKEIEKQTGIITILSNEDIDLGRTVEVETGLVDVEHLYKQVLNQENLEFKRIGDYIIIKAAEPVVAAPKQQDEQQILRGKVVDESGVPLPGVSIVIKGTTTGVPTDMDGNYFLPITERPLVLVFSFIGMEAQEHVINEQTELNVTLVAEKSHLNEVVVTGFQTISKERATGSFAIVNSDELNVKYMPSTQTMLEGKVAGVSSFGGETVMRGRASFRENASAPLVVVDGLPVAGGANMVNPADIESATFLKDAAATSIYGAEAANGVLVITTKKAKNKGLQVEVISNLVYEVKPTLDYFDFASTSDIMDYEQEYYNNEVAAKGGAIAYFDNMDQEYRHYSTLYDLNKQLAHGTISQGDFDASVHQLRQNDYRKQYMKHLYRNAFSKELNVSLSNAGERSNTFLSFNYKDNQEAQINRGSKAYNVYLKNTLQLNDFIDLNWGANARYSKERTPKGLKGSFGTLPYERLLDEDGNRVPYFDFNGPRMEEMQQYHWVHPFGYNALDEAELDQEQQILRNIRLFVAGKVKLLKDLSWEMNAQYEYNNVKWERYSEPESYLMRYLINTSTSLSEWGTPVFNIPDNGRLHTATIEETSYTVRNQLNYQKNIQDVHYVSALLGTQVREKYREDHSNYLYGYDDQIMRPSGVDWPAFQYPGVVGVYNPNVPVKVPFGDAHSEVTNRYVSLYANMGYSYSNRYNLTGSVRVDQSNLFGVAVRNRYRPLWSIGAAWNLHNEAFFNSNSVVNRLQLRTSYGTGGNVDDDTTPHLVINPGSADVFHGYPSASIHDAPNPLLRWELTKTFNVGVDATAFDTRLNTSVDVYFRKSTDLLAEKSFDPATGFAQGTVNNGAMTNRGVELTLSYDWIRNANFRWNSTLVGAWNKNTIDEVNFEVTESSDLLYYPRNFYEANTTFNSLYAFKYAGLTADGHPSVYNEAGEVVFNTAVDSPDALVIKGQLDPKVSGSLDNRWSYKGLELSAFVVFNFGHHLRRDVVSLYESVNNGSVHKDIVNRWTESNTDTEIPSMGNRLFNGDRSNHWKYADKQVEDASYVKLRNVALRYALPTRLCEKLKTQSVHLRLQANNLVYWSAAGDIDPEAFDANWGYRKMPLMPSYILGVDVKF